MAKAKSVMVTGATGLIGSYLVKEYLLRNWRVYGVIRNENKARNIFGPLFNRVKWINNELVSERLADVPELDLIIHTAAPTSGKFMVEKPVETIEVIVDGTRDVLRIAKAYRAKVVNLSSMEVYGNSKTEDKLREDDLCSMDLTNMRNTYPVAKRLAEMLCWSYYCEYGVDAVSLRLAAVIPNELSQYDNRVISYFAKQVKCGDGIILATPGNTKQSFVAIDDVMSAIDTVSQSGITGVYNVAGDNMYLSIYELAKMFADLSNRVISVRIDGVADVKQYPKPHFINLDTDNLKNIGWHPNVDMLTAIKRLIG